MMTEQWKRLLKRVALTGTVSAAALEPLNNEFTLNDLRTPAAVDRWQRNSVGAPAELRFLPDEKRLGGAGGAEVVWPGGATQPFIMLSGDNLPLKDWSDFDYLEFEAFNPDTVVQPFYLLATSPWAEGGAIAWSQDIDAPGWDWSTQLFLEPGRSTLRIPLSTATRGLRDIQVFRLAAETRRPTRFLLADVRLTTAEPRETQAKLAADIAAFEQKMQVDKPVAKAVEKSWTRLRQEVAELDAALVAAEAAGGWPDASAARCWRRGMALAQERLEQLEKRWPVVRFNAAIDQNIWGAWYYGWTDGVTKVFRNDEMPFVGEIGGTVAVELAGNEYEAAQVVLRTRRPVKHIRWQMSPLIGPDGTVLPPDGVTVAPVGYVNTIKSFYDAPFTGWWPDPICDYLTEIELPGETWQPLWVEFYAPAGQRPGRYTGTLTVTAEGMPDLAVPFVVEVHKFTVPVKHHLPTTFSAGMEFFGIYFQTEEEREKFFRYCGGEAELKDLGEGSPAWRAARAYEKTIDLMLAHRMALDNIYSPLPPRIEWLKKLKTQGIDQFSVVGYSGAIDPETNRLTREEHDRIFRQLEEFLPKLEAAGLLDMAKVYGFDEAQPDKIPALKAITDEIREKYPFLTISTTAFDSTYGAETGLDAIDIWCPLLPAFETEPEAIAAAQARGKKVWWYICCNPKAPYPNWFIEYPTAEARLLMGFLPWKYKPDGFLYYAMMLWKEHWDATGADGGPARQGAVMNHPLTTGPLTDFNGASLNVYNGDGELIYPGADGPVATMRIKAIRDGLEDYEYLWLLREAVEQVEAGRWAVPDGWLDAARAMLTVPEKMVKNLREFDRSGQEILTARHRIAELLDQVAK